MPKRKSVTLAGRMDNEDFQKNFECFEFLKADRPAEFSFTVLEMVPIEWEAHLLKLQEQAGEDTVPPSTLCIVYTEGMSEVWLGASFAHHMCTMTNFKLFDYPEGSNDPEAYHTQALRRYHRFLANRGHTYCYLLISINGEVMGQRVVFELFTDLCPRTCENFRHLCLGDCPDAPGDDDRSIRLHYKGTSFFRIMKDGWIQGGDIVNDRGNGGQSIYGSEFPDECFSLKHDSPGVLGLANNGKNTNGSQFYITVAQHSWMDGKYVAFGRVIEGLSVIRSIHATEVRHNQMPTVPIVIEDCGEVDLRAL